MRNLLSSSKECQSILPPSSLRGGVHNTPEEADEVTYHIGFQVDSTEQPTRIFDKLRDGSYHSVNNRSLGTGNVASNGGLPCISHSLAQLAQAQNMTNIGPKGERRGRMTSIAVSKELRNLFADTTFTDSVPITTGTNTSGPTGASRIMDQGSNAATPSPCSQRLHFYRSRVG